MSVLHTRKTAVLAIRERCITAGATLRLGYFEYYKNNTGEVVAVCIESGEPATDKVVIELLSQINGPDYIAYCMANA